MPNMREICDEIECLLSDTEFVRQVQWRVARVVNFCVKRTFNASKNNNIKEYAEDLGKGLEKLWNKLPEILNKRGKILSYINIPQAVLYLNSLGIRWRVLERTASERQYTLRIAVYHGEYFEDADSKNSEEKYNEKVFDYESRHLLRLVSCNPVPRRLVLLMNGCKWLPDKESKKYPFSLITLPSWGGDDEKEKRLIDHPPFDKYTYNELQNIFDWISGDEERVIHELTSAGIEVDKDNYLLSIYNIYRLNLKSKLIGTPPTSHLVYLPDSILPNIAPMGFSGMLYVSDVKNHDPDEYGRFIYLYQLLMTNLFSQIVIKAEASAIQVALHKGIQSNDTWQMMFANVGENQSSPPLLKEFGNAIARLPDQQDKWDKLYPDAPPEDFIGLYSMICEIIRDRFVAFVSPSGENYKTVEEAADANILEKDTIEKILSTPAFGYHALAREAYSTMVALWMNLHIIPPHRIDENGNKIKNWINRYKQKELIDESLLGLTEHLLFFEPTLHYIKSYRDHFLHSFNVLLLGYWLLSLNKGRSKNKYIILNNIRGNKRAQLLRLWTITATLHDIAYPLEKLKAGASELMGRYSKDGVNTFELKILPEWWSNITLPHSYGFIHDVLRRLTRKPMKNVKGSGPLFLWKSDDERKGKDVSSSEIAAKLLNMVGDKGQHGALAALILHNNLHKKDGKDAWKISRKKMYNLSEDDEHEICLALAIHHICDDLNNEPEWKLQSDSHPLSYLLILCDTIAQWGRTRIRDNDTHYATEVLQEEAMKLAYLYKIENDDSSVKIRIIYPYVKHPDVTDADGVAKFSKKYNQPFSLLKIEPNVTPLITVWLHGCTDPEAEIKTIALDKDNVSCNLT